MPDPDGSSPSGPFPVCPSFHVREIARTGNLEGRAPSAPFGGFCPHLTKSGRIPIPSKRQFWLQHPPGGPMSYSKFQGGNCYEPHHFRDCARSSRHHACFRSEERRV